MKAKKGFLKDKTGRGKIYRSAYFSCTCHKIQDPSISGSGVSQLPKCYSETDGWQRMVKDGKEYCLFFFFFLLFSIVS